MFAFLVIVLLMAILAGEAAIYMKLTTAGNTYSQEDLDNLRALAEKLRRIDPKE